MRLQLRAVVDVDEASRSTPNIDPHSRRGIDEVECRRDLGKEGRYDYGQEHGYLSSSFSR